MPRFLAFQEYCCKIFVLGEQSALAKKLVATRYKKFAFFKLVEHLAAPFRYGTRLNLPHQRNFLSERKNDRFSTFCDTLRLSNADHLRLSSRVSSMRRNCLDGGDRLDTQYELVRALSMRQFRRPLSPPKTLSRWWIR
jgi:hypothetical protein